MPSITLNNEGRPAANENYNGVVPASGNADFVLINQTSATVNVAVRGSSTTMGATLVSATEPADVTVFAAADRAAGDPVISAIMPAGAHIVFNANKSDAGAGNLQIQTGDLHARHMTSSQVDNTFHISVIV